MAKKKKNEKVEKYKRPTWDEYFMNLAELVGTRGTCSRGRSGCVITRDRQVLVTGYVGSPAGMPHCDDVGHEMTKYIDENEVMSDHCVRTIHAEMNALAQAAKLGISVSGATLYCHMTPCYTCAKILVNAGIKKVITLKDYHVSSKSKELFQKVGIKLVNFQKEVEDYKDNWKEREHLRIISKK